MTNSGCKYFWIFQRKEWFSKWDTADAVPVLKDLELDVARSTTGHDLSKPPTKVNPRITLRFLIAVKGVNQSQNFIYQILKTWSFLDAATKLIWRPPAIRAFRAFFWRWSRPREPSQLKTCNNPQILLCPNACTAPLSPSSSKGNLLDRKNLYRASNTNGLPSCTYGVSMWIFCNWGREHLACRWPMVNALSQERTWVWLGSEMYSRCNKLRSVQEKISLKHERDGGISQSRAVISLSDGMNSFYQYAVDRFCWLRS